MVLGSVVVRGVISDSGLTGLTLRALEGVSRWGRDAARRTAGNGRRGMRAGGCAGARALIVTDRFRVLRLINQPFLAAWRQLDPVGRQNRGLLSLMRRHAQRLNPEQQRGLHRYWAEHPQMRPVHEFKQRLCRLLLRKSRTARVCRRLIPLLLDYSDRLKACGLAALGPLGRTLAAWKTELARMWRFTRNNGIPAGFHTKMAMITRRAFGFRTFENHRLRVRILCA